MVTLFTLGIICLAAVILIPVILFLVGLPFLLLMGLLPWLLRIAGVVLLIKALLDKPTRWENFMPAVVAFAPVSYAHLRAHGVLNIDPLST